jgi:hypothetical protein
LKVLEALGLKLPALAREIRVIQSLPGAGLNRLPEILKLLLCLSRCGQAEVLGQDDGEDGRYCLFYHGI